MRHTGVRPYHCPYCPYTSIQASTYKVHLKTKHSVEDVSTLLFQCHLCAFRTLKVGQCGAAPPSPGAS